jgi:hypothetical protein
MPYRLGADLVLLAHAAFILFVIFGALAAAGRRRWICVHLAAVAWGALVELAGLWCPLTSVENALRIAAGDAGYAGGFVEHYLLNVIYPVGLTPHVQFLLGAGVLLVNAAIYLWVLLDGRTRRYR